MVVAQNAASPDPGSADSVPRETDRPNSLLKPVTKQQPKYSSDAYDLLGADKTNSLARKVINSLANLYYETGGSHLLNVITGNS